MEVKVINCLISKWKKKEFFTNLSPFYEGYLKMVRKKLIW